MPTALRYLATAAILMLSAPACAQSSLPQRELQALLTLPPQPYVGVQEYAALMAQRLRCRPGAAIMPRDQLLDDLRTDFHEQHDSTVYVLPTVLAELFLNRTSGTWTIVRTGPQKQACVVAAGQRQFLQAEL